MSNSESGYIQENVFGLEDPDNWGCEIQVYSVGHKVMQIGCRSIKTHIEIAFNSVEYFSGATKWNGANFRLHSREECIELLTKIHPSIQESIQFFLENDMFFWKLYSIQTKEGNMVQILSAKGHLVTENQ